MSQHSLGSRHISVRWWWGVPVLVAVLLAMAPLAGALSVHHEFAQADHDGHQHSDFDLCKWVQFNSGHSLVLEIVDISKPWVETNSWGGTPSAMVPSQLFLRSTNLRGPPLV